MLGNGRLGSPKCNKEISFVNLCRRCVENLSGFLGVYTCATWLNSNQASLFIVTLEDKKTLAERYNSRDY